MIDVISRDKNLSLIYVIFTKADIKTVEIKFIKNIEDNGK